MHKYVLMLSTSALILACGVIAAGAQQPADSHSTHHPDQQQTQQQSGDQKNPGMMPGGMMGSGMMGGREMTCGMMGRSAMDSFAMRMIFALMDADGDGTISLEEFQAAHEKIFKAMDVDKDGTVSFEEMMNFMHGSGRPQRAPSSR